MTLPQFQYSYLIKLAGQLHIDIDQLCTPILTQYGTDGAYSTGKYWLDGIRYGYKVNTTTGEIIYIRQEQEA